MLTHADILPLSEYEKIRPLKKQEILSLKNLRRVHVGPDITFYFENTQTIWWQIHEMLRIEKGGDAQIDDELSAYNPLIPIKKEKFYELSATMMIEIDDANRRKIVLQQLFGIDQKVSIEFSNITISARSIDPSEERNRESDKKTSSVHFLKWVIPQENINDFLNSDAHLEINHPFYTFKTVFSEALKESFRDEFELG